MAAKRAPQIRGRRPHRTSILNPYFLIWYTRSPASVFVDSILRPCFLAAVERKPRIECFCQSVAFTISARVAPLGRPISSRIFAPLLSARGAPDFQCISVWIFAGRIGLTVSVWIPGAGCHRPVARWI